MIIAALIFVTCWCAIGWGFVLFYVFQLSDVRCEKASLKGVVDSQGAEILELSQANRRLEDKLERIQQVFRPGLGESGSGVHGLRYYPCGCDETASETNKESGG